MTPWTPQHQHIHPQRSRPPSRSVTEISFRHLWTVQKQTPRRHVSDKSVCEMSARWWRKGKKLNLRVYFMCICSRSWSALKFPSANLRLSWTAGRSLWSAWEWGIVGHVVFPMTRYIPNFKKKQKFYKLLINSLICFGVCMSICMSVRLCDYLQNYTRLNFMKFGEVQGRQKKNTFGVNPDQFPWNCKNSLWGRNGRINPNILVSILTLVSVLDQYLHKRINTLFPPSKFSI